MAWRPPASTSLRWRCGPLRKRARAEGAHGSIRFREGDLTAAEIPGVEGAFDLLVDHGTLDDLDPAGRLAMAGLVANLARPGAAFHFWCFWARRSDLPRMSLTPLPDDPGHGARRGDGAVRR